MQNFKMSASEYLRCAPKYAISRLNNQKFSGKGAQPPPQRGGGYPLPTPYPLGTFGASLLAPSALVPPSKILATPLNNGCRIKTWWDCVMTWKVSACPKRMHSSGINGEGELRRQPANPGLPGKWPLKRSVCVEREKLWLDKMASINACTCQ